MYLYDCVGRDLCRGTQRVKESIHLSVLSLICIFHLSICLSVCVLHSTTRAIRKLLLREFFHSHWQPFCIAISLIYFVDVATSQMLDSGGGGFFIWNWIQLDAVKEEEVGEEKNGGEKERRHFWWMAAILFAFQLSFEMKTTTNPRQGIPKRIPG